jgi:ABC-type branched-subunit amino acid transport system substrate-binding protein
MRMNRHGAETARLSRAALLFLTTFVLATLSAPAQTPGVTDSSVLIGSCSALDGPAHVLGRQTVLGASAYLHMVNDDGGVFGRKVQLQAFDDSYDPDKAPACFKRMMKEGVFALGFFVGTPTAKVYVPMAEEEKIPVVDSSPARSYSMNRSNTKSSTSAPLITMRPASRSTSFGNRTSARSASSTRTTLLAKPCWKV